jgi:glyoxylase-like metal-dependent hydrolase (beta-lactamase superfamily II)
MGIEREIDPRARIDEQGRIKIPTSIIAKYGFRAGDEVFFHATEKGFEVNAKDPPTRILETLYLVGGLGTSHPWDGASYLIKGSEGSYLIDCGTEMGFDYIVENIRSLGVNPEEIKGIFLTHCHYDHSGAAQLFRQHFGTRIAIHELGRKPIEDGDDRWTASYVYKKKFPKYSVDETLRENQAIRAGEARLTVIHLPGHCPENTAFYGEINGKHVCFVGDIGGGHSENWHSSIEETKRSILILQKMDIDVLCHGHLCLTDENRIKFQLQTWWEMAQDAWFDYMLYDRL